MPTHPVSLGSSPSCDNVADERLSVSSFRLTTALPALLSSTLVVLGVLNFQQRCHYQLADDGVSWVDSPQGVTAWIVAGDSPADRAGLREGDTLRAIAGRPVKNSGEAAGAISGSGVWSQLTYDLVREGNPLHISVIITPQSGQNFLRYYLDFLGLLYLVIAAYILVRRRTSTPWPRLYAFCLVSFVLYTFSYTGKLDLFDWTVYWLNALAILLQPAIFLHFCLSFPGQQDSPRAKSNGVPLLYLPAALLLVLHVLVAGRIVVVETPLVTLRWVLDRVELVHLTVYFVVGALFLQRAQRRAHESRLKQEMKGVAWGAFLAIGPFAALYALPYSFGFVPAPWMRLSTLSLIFLPLSLGYVLLRRALAEMPPAKETSPTSVEATRRVA